MKKIFILICFISFCPFIWAEVILENGAFQSQWLDYGNPLSKGEPYFYRYYNSQYKIQGLLGKGWCLQLEHKINFTKNYLELQRCGQTLARFQKPSLKLKGPSQILDVQIRRMGKNWIVSLGSGNSWLFNSAGKLTTMFSKNGQMNVIWRPSNIIINSKKGQISLVRSKNSIKVYRNKKLVAHYKLKGSILTSFSKSEGGDLEEYSYNKFGRLVSITSQGKKRDQIDYYGKTGKTRVHRSQSGCQKEYTFSEEKLIPPYRVSVRTQCHREKEIIESFQVMRNGNQILVNKIN